MFFSTRFPDPRKAQRRISASRRMSKKDKMSAKKSVRRKVHRAMNLHRSKPRVRRRLQRIGLIAKRRR